MITPDCLSVTKETAVAWEDLKPQVLAEIMDCLTKGEAPVIEPTTTETDDLISQYCRIIERADSSGDPQRRRRHCFSRF